MKTKRITLVHYLRRGSGVKLLGTEIVEVASNYQARAEQDTVAAIKRDRILEQHRLEQAISMADENDSIDEML
jgi:hypothetical protein